MIDDHVEPPARERLAEEEKKALRYVILAQFITFSAIYLLFFASIALVEERTHSSAQTGWMIMSFSLPGFMLGMLAGVRVDRTDRRRLLMVGNILGMAIALVFILAVWAYSCIPRAVGQLKESASENVVGFWSEVSTGWRFIRTEPDVRRAIYALVLANAWMLMMASLLPGLATRVWMVPISSATYFAIPGGLGFAFGLCLISKRGRRRPSADWISAGLLTLGVGLALFPGLGRLEGIDLLYFILVSICVGMSFALILIPSRALVQERSPDSIRGRVVSTQLFLMNVGGALPLPLVGGIADTFGFQVTFTGLAMITLAAGILNIWSTRRE